MGYESEAMEIFLTKNIVKAQEIADKLNTYNTQRQSIAKRIFLEAVEKINNENIQDLSAIVVGGDNWHHGVIGIVASKLTEMYFKPTILICFEPDGTGKGSGRSIPGFDLHKALCDCDMYLERYGGHEMAVGLNVRKEKFDDFKKELCNIANLNNIKNFAPVILVDEQIDKKMLSFKAIEELKLLEPFGEGNKTPQFIYKNLKIDSIRTLSEGKHIKLSLKDDNIIVNGIGFNMGNIAEDYLIGDKVDIVGTLEINTFNGQDSIQINMKDIMKSL